MDVTAAATAAVTPIDRKIGYFLARGSTGRVAGARTDLVDINEVTSCP